MDLSTPLRSARSIREGKQTLAMTTGRKNAMAHVRSRWPRFDRIKPMQNIIDNLKEDLATVKDAGDIKSIYDKYLGKSGIIKDELSRLKDLSPEERRTKGPEIQAIQREAQELINARQGELGSQVSEQILEEQEEQIGHCSVKVGHLHPITKTIRMINRLFEEMGYSIIEGPEIETDEYCFQRLNVPLDHPARDMQDSLYIEEPNILLRTQTSSIEAHVLQDFKPPFKVVVPGRVYRNEKVSKSNHFIFHQYQAVVVLEKTSLKDLLGTFNHMFKKLYGDDVVVRYRNKYYPEVEPGVGLDMQCFSCKGVGCPLCKGVGWIEMGGAGMIHPKVLEMAGINKDKWMGFAFGLGLDRWVMAKYKIKDIRTLLGGNLAYRMDRDENSL